MRQTRNKKNIIVEQNLHLEAHVKVFQKTFEKFFLPINQQKIKPKTSPQG
jgi:hypothetical protein